MNRLLLYLKGIAMGAADVVPGVSGGTIAFITGIYEELIETLSKVDLKTFKLLLTEGFKSFWKEINGNFLIFLFAGIGTSIVSLSKLISYLLETYPILVWAFFFGLIVASAWIIGKTVSKWSIVSIIGLIAGVIIAYMITVISPAETSEEYWFIALSGAIAICAMILPGISGSFILLLMGKYKFILASISEMRFDVIFFFGLGCIIGLLSFARFLTWLFKNHKNITIALLSGFMIGSLNKVWPWKTTLETGIDRHGEIIPIVQESVSPFNFEGESNLIYAIILAVLGASLILVLNRFSPDSKEN